MKMKKYSRRIEYSKASEQLSKPLSYGRLDIELTERCNNKCLHCYINHAADDVAVKQRELSTEEIKNILKEAASIGFLSVRFTGGEPLLREDFEELYLYARKQGLKVILFTNATLIDDRLAELFARIPPLDKMEVTVYGLNKNSYENVSKSPGSFEAAWRGINLLLEKNIPFIVKGTVLPPNKEELDDFETWASSIPWMDKPPGYAMFLDLRGRRDSEHKNRIIKKLRLSPEEGAKILERSKNYIKNMQEFCSKFMRPPGDKLFSCGAGVGGGTVDAYGIFQPCMLLRHPDCVYDLRSGSMKDALENFFPKLRSMKSNNPEYLTRCARCFLKGLCEQCPGKSWIEHGDLDTPVEYLCQAAHAQARNLGLIEQGEHAWKVKDWEARIHEFSKKTITQKGK
jgi:radical SAM protein with 4Fe4S-binding SPASM domain